MSYIVSDQCVSCDVNGGTAILDLRTNTYFSLDPVGASIWLRLANSATEQDLVAMVVEEYDTEASICGPDISALLSNMLQHNLIVKV